MKWKVRYYKEVKSLQSDRFNTPPIFLLAENKLMVTFFVKMQMGKLSQEYPEE